MNPTFPEQKSHISVRIPEIGMLPIPSFLIWGGGDVMFPLELICNEPFMKCEIYMRFLSVFVSGKCQFLSSVECTHRWNVKYINSTSLSIIIIIVPDVFKKYGICRNKLIVSYRNFCIQVLK